MRRLFFLLLCLPVLASAQTISTIAGTGMSGFSGDGGIASVAQLNQPSDVFKDNKGNIYIADRGNNRIRKVNTSGIITTVAGNGISGYNGDGGPATAASLNAPTRVVVDGLGNIYIADRWNNRIRKVDTRGIISTVVGTGIPGFSGDNGQAVYAQIDSPTAVAIDIHGNLYVADSGNSRIRKVTPTGAISTYAGGGTYGYSVDGVPATSIRLCTQTYVSVDNSGTVYITNRNCFRFLKITTAGLIYDVAGYNSAAFSGDGGPADSANIEGPTAITPDNLGNVYLVPRTNDRVRKVDGYNIISTIAGTGNAGYTGDGGPATNAALSATMYGIYADEQGGVYIADMGNNVIRLISPAEIISDRVVIYPNPATSQLTVSSSENIYSIAIINILGQKVYSNQYNSPKLQVDVSVLPPGVYVVNINGSTIRKFVKL